MRRFDLDRLNNLPRRKAQEAAFAAISGVQNASAEEQIAGLAMTVLLAAERAGVDPHTIYTVALNLIRPTGDARKDHYVEAIRNFMNEEWV
jgi:hypothetical protein